MFKVYNKYSREITNVYKVEMRYGSLEFLVYINDVWIWTDAGLYMPIESEVRLNCEVG